MQVENAKNLDAVISMYNLIKYCHNNLETFVCLWQYSTDGIRNTITNSTSFK